jgi:hypothetical protein
MSYIVLRLAAIALATTAVAAVADTQAPPKIESFQLDGERWTCTADGKPLSGVMLKPDGKGLFPAIVLSHGLGRGKHNNPLPGSVGRGG